MYGQMTAGSWIYIGTQGILQGTYETFAAVAAKQFGGTLAGHAHPDRRLRRHGRRPAAGRHHERRRRRSSTSTATRLRPPGRAPLPRRGGRRPRRRARSWPSRPRDDRRAAVDRRGRQRRRRCCPSCCAAASPIDIVTDQTSAHDPLAYLPIGVDVDDWRRLRGGQAGGVHRPGAGVDGQARRGDGRLPGRGRRGVRLRQLDPRRGPAGRLRAGVRLPRLRARLHPAAVLRGQGPVPLGGAVRRPGRHRRDRPGGARPVPGERVPAPLDPMAARSGSRFQGLPARICWLGYGERDKAGRAVQRAWSPPASCPRRS